MKITLAAAGALLLGTSAMAWAAGADDPHDLAWKDAGAKSTSQLKYAVNDVLADAKAEPAAEPAAWADQAFKAEPAAWSQQEWKAQPAAATWVEEEADKPIPAAADYWATIDADKAGDEPMVEETGVGGPFESVDTADAGLAPRQAAQNYPPCDPGPGDDNCIQLYEPGVRTALASWNAPTGGLAGDNAATAMGGPYEPVGESTALASDESMTKPEDYAGTGGPLDEAAYPVCRSRSDDRCIQLDG